ncbi:hypothetical protein [Streptomyces sp. NPDC057302]|uniref:phage tail protein n=1 Tax=Streptomyces sp. NPDC057302 TaxID=3346094 RepID=UPI00363DE404
MALAETMVDVNADVSKFKRTLRRELRDHKVAVKLEADWANFRRKLRQVTASLTVKVGLDPDVASLRTRLSAMRPSVPVRLDPDTALLNARLRTMRPSPVTVPVRGDTSQLTRSLRGLTRFLPSAKIFAMGLAIVMLGAQAAVTSGQIVAFTASLAPLFGIIAAAPASLAGAGAALGALALAADGVKQAFRPLQGQFDAMKKSASAAIYTQLSAALRGTSGVMSQVKSAATGIATEWGRAGAAAINYIKSSRGMQNVSSITEGARKAVKGLADGTKPLITGFMDLAGVVSDTFGRRLGMGIEDVTTKFGTWMTKVSQSGQALGWVNNALTAFKSLGTILGSLGGIFNAVFSAARAASGDLLLTVGSVLKEVERFLKSGEGQSSLVSLFRGLQQVGVALGPVFSQLISSLGQIAPLVGQLAIALGPGVAAAIKGIGDAITAMGPGLLAFGTALSDAFVTLGPILPQVGAALGAVLAALSPLVTVAAAFLSVIVPIAAQLIQFAAPLLPIALGIMAAVKAFALLRTIIVGVQLVWATLNFVFAASPIGLIVVGVIALVAALVLAYQRFEGFRNVVQTVFGFLQGVGMAVIGAFVAAWRGIVIAAQATVSFFSGLPGTLGGILSAVAGAVGAGLGAVVGFFAALPGRILGALAWLAGGIASFFSGMFSGVRSIVSSGVSATVSFFAQLPGRALGAVRSLLGSMGSFFRSVFAAARSATTSGISAVVSLARGIPGKIVSALGSLASKVGAVFTKAWQAAKRIGGQVVSFARNLPGNVVKAMGNIGSKIASMIKSTIPGPLKKFLPFARGGIVTGPTRALIGEAGPEVVIPLTRPQRARELLYASGAASFLDQDKGRNKGAGSGNPLIGNVQIVTPARDPEAVALAVAGRLARASF